MAENQRTFGSLIRRYRVIAGLTQEGLAERAGLSLRGVSDLERGLRLLGTSRQVTLTGVGGVGKTRLALEVARQRAAAFGHGVHFVSLAGVGAANLVASAIANVLGVSLGGPAEPEVRLVQYLRDKHLLLVLDNFEHLLEGAGLLIEILNSASEVSILVTSRERAGTSSCVRAARF